MRIWISQSGSVFQGFGWKLESFSIFGKHSWFKNENPSGYILSHESILSIFRARVWCLPDPGSYTSYNSKNSLRGHTDLNHGPIGLQPIALPLSYIPCQGAVVTQVWDRRSVLQGGQVAMSMRKPYLTWAHVLLSLWRHPPPLSAGGDIAQW